MRQLSFQYSVKEWRHWTMPYALRAILKDFAEPMLAGVLNRVPLPSVPTRPLDNAISIAGHFQRIFSEPMHMGTTTPNFMLAAVYVRYPHPKKLGCATLRADQSACLLCALQKAFWHIWHALWKFRIRRLFIQNRIPFRNILRNSSSFHQTSRSLFLFPFHVIVCKCGNFELKNASVLEPLSL